MNQPPLTGLPTVIDALQWAKLLSTSDAAMPLLSLLLLTSLNSFFTRTKACMLTMDFGELSAQVPLYDAVLAAPTLMCVGGIFMKSFAVDVAVASKPCV
jgi:hypothetical protein